MTNPDLASIIAIDGPVASGKSSIGRQLADRLGYVFFDTGVLYRAITLLALQAGLDLSDTAALENLARTAVLRLTPPTVADGREATLLANGVDVTWAVRSKDVEDNVSRVAAVPGVRQALTAQMRAIGLRGRVVMVGRDVGTVIVPEAGHKLFLTASVETRARRRFAEIQARGERRTYEDILANVRERDRIDTSRALAPLSAAPDAITLDTSDMDVPAVLAAIEQALALTPAP